MPAPTFYFFFINDKCENKTNIIPPTENLVPREENEKLKDVCLNTILNEDGTTSTVLQKTIVKCITENEPIKDNQSNNISYVRQKQTIYTMMTKEVVHKIY